MPNTNNTGNDCQLQDPLQPERRRCPLQDPDFLLRITTQAAELAAQRVQQQAYIAIGKGVVSKFLYVVGIITTWILSWATSKGYLS